jgi:beta propeller repeat protein
MRLIGRKSLLALSAAAVALFATGCAANRLDPNDFDQVSPAFSGNQLAWEDSRNVDQNFGTDVYMWNTDTAKDALVAGGALEQDQPAISDSYVVWIDEHDGLMARALPLSDSRPAFPVVNGPATQSDPALCGSVVVWSDTRNNSDVYAKQLPNGPEYQIATSSAVEAYPACDAGRVVYSYSPLGGQSDIRLYNLANGQTTNVANQLWNEWRPAISGDRVVWQAWPTQGQPGDTEGIDILGKDLGTGQPISVSTATGSQTAPTISGSIVAWQDDRNQQSQIWWRDLASSVAEQAVDPNLHGTQQDPALSGNRVAFQSNAPGPWNTYLALLPHLQ